MHVAIITMRMDDAIQGRVGLLWYKFDHMYVKPVLCNIPDNEGTESWNASIDTVVDWYRGKRGMQRSVYNKLIGYNTDIHEPWLLLIYV